jgi:hypothetical protein
MLPEPDDRPSGFAKPQVGVAVAVNVGLELGDPPLRVRSRNGAVLRAAVEETAVDETGDTCAGEQEIGTPAT